MIRVLHLLGALRPSGMEKMLLAAAPHWARHGVACSVLSTGDSPGSFAPTLKQAGYPIHHIPFHRANPLPHAWQIFRLLRTELHWLTIGTIPNGLKECENLKYQ